MVITYARSRLWTGILSVGFWVLWSLGILLFGDLVTSFSQKLSLAEAVITIIIIYILFSLPFDLVGGWILPRKFKRSTLSFSLFMKSYLKGIGFHSAFLFLIGSMLLLIIAITPFFWQWIVMLIFGTMIQFFLLYFQNPIARLLGNFGITSSPEFEVWQSSDIGFTGGISLRKKKMVLPKDWIVNYSPKEIQLLLDRREFIIHSSSYKSGVRGAILFNLIGFLIGNFGCQQSGITIASSGYFSYLLFWSSYVTLWSFVGLLVLPTLSQKATIFADTKWKNVEKSAVTHLITQLDQFQDKEPKRSAGIQMIFHPISSVELRMKGLENESSSSLNPWHIARHSLYLSWGGWSLLGRAVHCNVGRPDLWVFLPTDG